jgi:hypothetical protein
MGTPWHYSVEGTTSEGRLDLLRALAVGGDLGRSVRSYAEPIVGVSETVLAGAR